MDLFYFKTTRRKVSGFRPIWNYCNKISAYALKGLSHEIDFKNVVKNGQILALIRAAAGF